MSLTLSAKTFLPFLFYRFNVRQEEYCCLNSLILIVTRLAHYGEQIFIVQAQIFISTYQKEKLLNFQHFLQIQQHCKAISF